MPNTNCANDLPGILYSAGSSGRISAFPSSRPVAISGSYGRAGPIPSRESVPSRPRVEVLVEVHPDHARVAEEERRGEDEFAARDGPDRRKAPAGGESRDDHGRRERDRHRVAEIHRPEEVPRLAL